jgi:hypothetical protein
VVVEAVQQHKQLFMLVQAVALAVVALTVLIQVPQVLLGKGLLAVMVQAPVIIPAEGAAVQQPLVYLQQQIQVMAVMVGQASTGNLLAHSTQVVGVVVGMAALLEQVDLVVAVTAEQPQLGQMALIILVVAVAALGLIAQVLVLSGEMVVLELL